MKDKKIHYGWIIVIACNILLAATIGIISNSSSLFIKPISDDLGVSRRAVSSTISLLAVGGMITSLFAGRIFNDHNIIAIMKVSVIILTISFFANSFFNSIYPFYITSAINGVCLILVTSMPITFILNNWFKTDVGTALGLASMGSGIGGALFNALAGIWIEAYGWRVTYRILTAVILVLAIPCIYFVIKRSPEEKGCTPYEKRDKDSNTKTEKEYRDELHRDMTSGVTFEQARRTKFFRIFCGCAIGLGMCMNGMYYSISPRLQDLGYSISFSANFLAVGMFVMAAGQILLGKIFDKQGVRSAFTLANLCLLASQIGLLIAGKTPFGFILVFAGLLFGVVYGTVCIPLAIPLIFGKRDYKAIMGFLAAMVSFGGALGPIFAGAIYDSCGSYNPAYVIFSVIMAVIILRTYAQLPDKAHQIG